MKRKVLGLFLLISLCLQSIPAFAYDYDDYYDYYDSYSCSVSYDFNEDPLSCSNQSIADIGSLLTTQFEPLSKQNFTTRSQVLTAYGPAINSLACVYDDAASQITSQLTSLIGLFGLDQNIIDSILDGEVPSYEDLEPYFDSKYCPESLEDIQELMDQIAELIRAIRALRGGFIKRTAAKTLIKKKIEALQEQLDKINRQIQEALRCGDPEELQRLLQEKFKIQFTIWLLQATLDEDYQGTVYDIAVILYRFLFKCRSELNATNS